MVRRARLQLLLARQDADVLVGQAGRARFAGRSAEEKAKVWEGEGSSSGAAKMATPITPLANKPGRQMTPITPAGAMRRPAPSMAMGPPGKLPRGRF